MFILASLLSQILRQNQSLTAFVYEDFVTEGQSPTIQNLKAIIQALIPRLKTPRFLVDGIDECIRYDNRGKPQDLSLAKDVLLDILQLETFGSGNVCPKLFLVSRDIMQLVSKLSKRPTVALENEAEAMRSTIRSFTRNRLQDIGDKFEDFPNIKEVFDGVEEKIVSKSQGEFF